MEESSGGVGRRSCEQNAREDFWIGDDGKDVGRNEGVQRRNEKKGEDESKPCAFVSALR